MKKKDYIFVWVVILLVVVMVIFVVVLFGSMNADFSPELSGSEECKIISEVGSDATNVVFFANKDDSVEYSDYLLSTNPFDEGEFNVYYIDSYKPSCELYKGVAVLCYNKELIKKASSCPNDYIFVLNDMDESIRSSSYMNVVSANLRSPKSVVVHEFGHAFANLADEYFANKVRDGSKNCQLSCEDFVGDKDGCYFGCGDDGYYRSIDEGVMRTLSTREFGIYNENLIRNRLGAVEDSWFTGSAVEDISLLNRDCDSESFYLLKFAQMKSDEGKNKIVLLGRENVSGCIGGVERNGYGGVRYELIDKENNVIEVGRFNGDYVFTDSQVGDKIEGEVFESEEDFYLKVPVSEEIDAIDIDGFRFEISLNFSEGSELYSGLGDIPMDIEVVGPICGSYYDEGEEVRIIVNVSDNDIVYGDVLVGGEIVRDFGNDGADFVYTLSEGVVGNVQVVAQGYNSKGEIGKSVSNIMILDRDDVGYVDGEYIAACISEPEDSSHIGSGIIEFNASTTRGVRVLDGVVDVLVPGEYNFSWYWRFMPEDVVREFEKNSSEDAYQFLINFASSGDNWAELGVDL